MIVYCENDKCRHCNFDGECLAGGITLWRSEESSDENDLYCEEFEDVTAGADYQDPFFRRMDGRKNDGVVFKEPATGKKIELDGLIFFTSENTLHGNDYSMTEEKTGYCITKSQYDRYKDKVAEVIAKESPVADLPLKQHDKSGKEGQ